MCLSLQHGHYSRKICLQILQKKKKGKISKKSRSKNIVPDDVASAGVIKHDL